MNSNVRPLNNMEYMYVTRADTIRMHSRYATCALDRLWLQAVTMHTMLILVQS